MNLSTLTIGQAHEKLRSKEVSSTELTQACIAQIEKVDKKLNAVVHRNFERALEEAKKADTKGVFDSPLVGIPYLAKDVFCEEGVPTTACSNMLRNKDYLPPFDSTTTKRLKAVGAISMGKTNTDEFTMGASTETSPLVTLDTTAPGTCAIVLQGGAPATNATLPFSLCACSSMGCPRPDPACGRCGRSANIPENKLAC